MNIQKIIKGRGTANRILGRCLRKDINSRNMDSKLSVRKVGQKYMIYDNDIGEFVIGYTFNNANEANRFIGN